MVYSTELTGYLYTETTNGMYVIYDNKTQNNSSLPQIMFTDCMYCNIKSQNSFFHSVQLTNIANQIERNI